MIKWSLLKLCPYFLHSVSVKSPSLFFSLSFCRSDAVSKLKLLHSGDWLSRRTAAVTVQFTLFSPAANLFSSVTLLAQRSPVGVLIPSVRVQSVRLYHNPAVWDYAVMACQVKASFSSLVESFQTKQSPNKTASICFTRNEIEQHWNE